MDKANTNDKTNQITGTIFFGLLLWRIFQYPIAFFFWGEDPTKYPEFFVAANYFCTFLLVTIAIWLNKDHLERLNIDKTFYSIYLFAGFLLSFLYFTSMASLFILLVTGMMFLNLLDPCVFVDKQNYSWGKIVILILLLFLPIVISLWIKFVVLEINPGETGSVWNVLFRADFPMVLCEEFVFRGLLWKYLKEKNYSVRRIVIVQAVLFWVAHIYYIFDAPIFFWVILPFYSLLLGVLVARSKSLTPSTIAHYFLNVGVGILIAF